MTEAGRVAFPFFPHAWQLSVWERLARLAAEQRLPHALLVGGPAGIGKLRLAQAFSAYMLCAARTATSACGKCKSCSLLAAGSHPDYLVLTPETDPKTEKVAKFIKVDQVRELVEFASKSAQLGGYRVVLIEPAHLLNMQAANALLKTLEEPGRQTLILLVTPQPLSLSATIRSRCQQLQLGMPDEAAALAWLAPQLRDRNEAQLLLGLAGGAPLAALALRDSLWFGERERLLKDLAGLREGRLGSLAAAQRWQGLGADAVVQALASLLEDMARVAMGSEVVKHHDLAPIIQAICRRVAPAALLSFRQGLADKQRLLAGNIQGGLLLDAVFSEWGRLARA